MRGQPHSRAFTVDESGLSRAHLERHRAIAALGARQHGVVSRRQLLALGLGPDAIDRRIRSGLVRRLHRGVYLLGTVLGPHSREFAAVLAYGPGAALSHRSAASLWGLLPYSTPAPIDVTARGGDPRGRPGIALHRALLIPAELRTRHRIPVTSPARTLLDLAAISPRDLERALTEAYARGVVRRRELQALITRRRRHRGARRLRALTEAPPALTRSEAERRFLALVRKASLPAPEVNVRLEAYEVDFLWRPQRLIVEVDGYAFHSSRRAFEDDRRRDADLAARGFHVIRITWWQIISEPEAVVGRLAQALARADRD
jgi:very-short-patch-repair endonuclease